MKIAGYRTITIEDGITVSEIAETAIPIEHVIREEILSGEPFQAPVWCSGAPAEPEGAPQPGPVRFRRADGSLSPIFRGCLFYESISELVDFLLHRYEPPPDLPVGRLMAALKQDPLGRRKLEEMISRENFRFHRRRLSRTSESHEERPPICNKGDFLHREGTAVLQREGTFFFPRVSGQDGVTYVRPTRLQRGRHAIPRHEILFNHVDWDEKDVEKETSVVHFDGNRAWYYRSRARVPQRVLARLDTGGSAYPGSAFAFLPRIGLRARCLVRIPARSVLATYDQAARRPRHRVLRSPALVCDSREPIPIPRGVPIINTPDAARFVLSRLVNGFYLPADAAVPLSMGHWPEDDSYLVLCDAAGLV